MMNFECWIGTDGEFWILNVGFWVNFRQEDRICRKGVKKKLKWLQNGT
jgi:hypothetical protein